MIYVQVLGNQNKKWLHPRKCMLAMFVIATLMCVLVGTSNQVFNLMKNKDHKDGKIHSLKRFNKADYD